MSALEEAITKVRDAKIYVPELDRAKEEVDRLVASAQKYLDFAKDVVASPVAPELKPIRDEMRAALAPFQPGRGAVKP